MNISKSDVEELRAREIKGCQECPWKDRKSRTVPFDGNPDYGVLFVGRNPGRDEDRIGKPFVGRGGKILDRFLLEIGVDRKKIMITNVSKCYGAPNDIPPTVEVQNICEPFIQSEIKLFQPKLIVLMGNDAVSRCTGDTSSTLHIEGTLRTYRHLPDKKFFCMTHPGYWLRNMYYFTNTVLSKVAPALKICLQDLDLYEMIKDSGSSDVIKAINTP